MASISQLLLERNIRQQLQRDQQQVITIETQTLGTVRVAIFFTFFAKLLMFASLESLYIHHLGAIINVTHVLGVVVYMNFLYHIGRYVQVIDCLCSLTIILTFFPHRQDLCFIHLEFMMRSLTVLVKKIALSPYYR